MHRDLRLCYQNWTSPLDAAKLLDLFVSRPLFTEPHQTFIKQTMIECETGKDRLAQPLEATDAIIGHKTGNGRPECPMATDRYERHRFRFPTG